MITPRRHQYAIGPRRHRQRLAQRLGSGMDRQAAAAAERLSDAELAELLADASFRALVTHYEELHAQAPEARLDRLARMALDLLELALAAGDVRAAIFFATERRAGRDPARRLAMLAVERLERAVTAPPAAPVAPRRRDPDVRATPRGEADFPYCAATCADEAAVVRLAERSVGAFAGAIAATGAAMAARLVCEAEREGTAALGQSAGRAAAQRAAVVAFAVTAAGDPLAGLRAARKLAARRTAFARGAAVAATTTEPARLAEDPQRSPSRPAAPDTG